MTKRQKATRHSRATFVFTPELGGKLRHLRRQRSLTMKDLASLMGRDSPGAFNHLAKLEQGKLSHPSVNLLLDYLRGCGAGPQDLAALFGPYLSLPPVPRVKADAAVKKLVEVLPGREQQKVLTWDKGMTKAYQERKMGTVPRPGRSEGLSPFSRKKQPRVETDQQRVIRIVWSFVHANWNEVFEQQLYEAMLKLRDDVPRSRRKVACDLSRRYFGVLTRYYANAARRKNALDRIEQKAEEEGFSKQTIAALIDAAMRSYQQLLLSGRLDWEPTQEEIIRRRGQAPAVLKAEVRLEIDEARPVSEENKAQNLVRVMVQMAVNEKLEEKKLDHFSVKRHYQAWIDRLVEIGFRHGPGSPEWQTAVDATAPKLHDEAFARQMAALAAETFNRWTKPRAPGGPSAT